jgi:hypothetical protein
VSILLSTDCDRTISQGSTPYRVRSLPWRNGTRVWFAGAFVLTSMNLNRHFLSDSLDRRGYVNMLVVLWVDSEKGSRPSARPTETRPAGLPATQRRRGRTVALLDFVVARSRVEIRGRLYTDPCGTRTKPHTPSGVIWAGQRVILTFLYFFIFYFLLFFSVFPF